MALARVLPVCFGWSAAAAVVEVDEDGFVSAFELRFDATPERVYDALVKETDVWWDPAHTFSGDASNLAFAAVPGAGAPAAVYARCGRSCRARATSSAT